MKRMMLRTSLLGLCLAATAPNANACSDLPNICQQQQQIFEQNNEMARQANEAWVQSVWDDYDAQREEREALAAPPARDPMQETINMALDGMLQAKRAVDDKAKLLNDPRYKAYVKGSWTFFQDTNKKKPGEFCAAFFTKEEGFVMLSGPGPGYDGAMLTFWGMKVPRPKNVRKIKVTLKQTDSKPQTVTAFNYFNAAHGMAAIGLAVPTIKAALDGSLDKHSFELIVDGKSVAKVSWHGGNAMKKKLAACVAKRVVGK